MDLDRQKYLEEFKKWYSSLEQYKQNNGPAKGTIAASLVVLDRLKADFDLNLRAHLAPRGTQIKGASGKAIKKILQALGETRPYAKEGGRTNRGGLSEIEQLLSALNEMQIQRLEEAERNQVLIAFQSFLVDRVRDYHNRQKIKLVFDPALSTWQNMNALLETASKENKGGPVAQHLVGAKLQLRFPSIQVANESAFTADQQTGRQGDFQIRDAVFHVTISPMSEVFQKCRENLQDGLKVYLLVPDGKLAGARQLADEIDKGRIAVESIESFMSQNIEEIGNFDRIQLATNLAELISLYNRRVDAIEVDKSLMIELPENLSR